ncbi:hypothetical protein BJ508DRAFT_412361 [Ascobolus immersus RN42]|uniref:Uncharacterized protein n=1 Tax=Ascobolus immersus RN42 TaxID=1160509 RepID=A0A3N4IJQ0_ASCIM|nr:hypothetical protein BJ508DRAFT_412361 [Ascobolus immersus RN42]
MTTSIPQPKESTQLVVVEHDPTPALSTTDIRIAELLDKALDGAFTTIWNVFNTGSFRNLLEQCGIERAKVDQLRDWLYLSSVAFAWMMGEYVFVVESRPKMLELKRLPGSWEEDEEEDVESESEGEEMRDGPGKSDDCDSGVGGMDESEVEDDESESEDEDEEVPLDVILKALGIPITSCRIERVR